jgi:hypothetical protein
MNTFAAPKIVSLPPTSFFHRDVSRFSPKLNAGFHLQLHIPCGEDLAMSIAPLSLLTMEAKQPQGDNTRAAEVHIDLDRALLSTDRVIK